jgi:glycosyltransferase involved in cell wall biosynthesis
MNPPGIGFLDLDVSTVYPWRAETPSTNGHSNGHVAQVRAPNVEFLRQCAWEIGERRPADGYRPTENHVALGMVTPAQGFAQWRIRQEWVDETAWHKGSSWQNCRLVLRLYDVSFLEFNGFNAHRIQDETLPGLCGQFFFKLPGQGTFQIGEVGFLLRSGEFVPAARSRPVAFPASAPSRHGSQAALLVTDRGHHEEIGNVWDQERILRDRRQPHLKPHLRLATFTFAPNGELPRFVAELTAGQGTAGHEVHLFVAGVNGGDRQEGAVHYHPLPLEPAESPVDQAQAFGQTLRGRLNDYEPFDLLHIHEWMAGFVPRLGCPTVLSLTSTEAVRLGSATPGEDSQAIQRAEREAAQSVDCILTPDWLRERAIAELDVDGARVRAFPLEGRLANEWEAPLDYGQVKKDIGLGPLDRMLLFVGPLEHATGVDLLIEALPTLLQRMGNLRLAFIGAGNLYGHIQHRAYQVGGGHAVRLLGHQEGSQVTKLMRAAEALILPSRHRVPFDDAVVDLARRAGRPVVTTHGGPAHLVRHEENGIVTYDNPGSMVWALDRILGDPSHAERMGQNGRRSDGGAPRWSEVARHYLELCAASFPQLTETWW